MIIDWIILLLMALFTYLIVRRSVAGVTTTPVWLLWLVLMTPPFVWSLWVVVYGAKQLPPIELLIGMSILSIFFYLKLHQKGRKNLTLPQQEQSKPTLSNSLNTILNHTTHPKMSIEHIINLLKS